MFSSNDKQSVNKTTLEPMEGKSISTIGMLEPLNKSVHFKQGEDLLKPSTGVYNSREKILSLESVNDSEYARINNNQYNFAQLQEASYASLLHNRRVIKKKGRDDIRFSKDKTLSDVHSSLQLSLHEVEATPPVSTSRINNPTPGNLMLSDLRSKFIHNHDHPITTRNLKPGMQLKDRVFSVNASMDMSKYNSKNILLSSRAANQSNQLKSLLPPLSSRNGSLRNGKVNLRTEQRFNHITVKPVFKDTLRNGE